MLGFLCICLYSHFSLQKVTSPSTFSFWSKSSVDIEPRRIRLQSSSYTTNTLLDTVTAATVQVRISCVILSLLIQHVILAYLLLCYLTDVRFINSWPFLFGVLTVIVTVSNAAASIQCKPTLLLACT